MVLQVAQAVDGQLGSAEREPREARRRAERRRSLAADRGTDELPAVRVVREEFRAGHHPRRKLALDILPTAGMELRMRLPLLGTARGVEVGAVERVIRDMPEGVLSDLALPLRIGADANALVEHVEGGVELAGDERLVGGEVHRLAFMFRARRSARPVCRWSIPPARRAIRRAACRTHACRPIRDRRPSAPCAASLHGRIRAAAGLAATRH